MISLASITICKEQVYMPILGITNSGLYMDTNPVFICNPIKEEMVISLQKVQEYGHPQIEVNSSEDRLKHEKVMLTATGMKSWKELARNGYSYVIMRSEKEIQIEMSKLDKKGRWEFDPQKRTVLPVETSIIEIIKTILDDYYSRN